MSYLEFTVRGFVGREHETKTRNEHSGIYARTTVPETTEFTASIEFTEGYPNINALFPSAWGEGVYHAVELHTPIPDGWDPVRKGDWELEYVNIDESGILSHSLSMASELQFDTVCDAIRWFAARPELSGYDQETAAKMAENIAAAVPAANSPDTYGKEAWDKMYRDLDAAGFEHDYL